jgi:type IV secretion system protein VirB10
MQSRVSNLLAMTLMLAVGVAFLAWYYLHLKARPALARQLTQQSLADKAGNEMTLPSLGKLEPPVPVDAAGPDPSPPAQTVVSEAPPLPSQGETPSVPAQPARQTALERRLSGVAFASAGGSNAVSMGTQPAAELREHDPAQHSVAGAPSDAMAELLTASPTRTAVATVLPSQRLLLAKGAFIDCTLETAIDSTLPGLTTCVTATDTFGADGTVVLLERGTKLMGETRGQVQQASSRVFVLWTEARTPAGVVVPLDSPGADELGRAGLPGQVDRHFWERFGAAILISTIDGSIQAALQSAGSGNGTVIYNPSGPQEVLGEVLKSTVNIPPTVIKNNGDRIQVLVARDVDFSRVYELRHAISHP